MDAPVILWFRSDLRLTDNPAFDAALKTGAPILPLYILDDAHAGAWKMGAASRVWLYHSLKSLNQSLDYKMIFAAGSAAEILPELIQKTGARGVYWNRCYEPATIARDKKIKETLAQGGTQTHSFNANLLYEPWEVLKKDGTPYRVFTPFWQKGCAAKGPPPQPRPAGPPIQPLRHPRAGGDPALRFYDYQGLNDTIKPLDDLALLPHHPRWDIEMIAHWQPGEAGAQKRFDHFLKNGLRSYKEGRNRPDLENISRLSPHLHFGEISVRQIYHTVQMTMASDPTLENDGTCFLSELGWREFSHHLLYHFPNLPEHPLQQQFQRFPWASDDQTLIAWQRGQTGFPIVDAGMRELWATGYMHNRVRMIVGSFLVKNMLTHWRAGENWFWDTLLDADLANNAASWQWIAGCGADAAPYFRIFNPVLQGEKFDPNGAYVRRYVPELARLPDKYIHQPWAAPPLTLAEAGVKLGITYPNRLMDHAAARDRALCALKTTKI